MAITMTDVKNILRGWLGHKEDSSNTVLGLTGQLLRKHHLYAWPPAAKAVASGGGFTLPRLSAQTGSLSSTQPIAERTIFVADKPCRVTEMTFAQYISSTVSTSATTSWTLLILKRGKGNGTLSSTYSVTNFIGGLCSMSAGQPGFSNSYSQLAFNVAHRPNKLFLASSGASTKLSLKRGDILTAQVKKGASGVATSNGAQFPGGIIKTTVEEE